MGLKHNLTIILKTRSRGREACRHSCTHNTEPTKQKYKSGNCNNDVEIVKRIVFSTDVKKILIGGTMVYEVM